MKETSEEQTWISQQRRYIFRPAEQVLCLAVCDCIPEKVWVKIGEFAPYIETMPCLEQIEVESIYGCTASRYGQVFATASHSLDIESITSGDSSLSKTLGKFVGADGKIDKTLDGDQNPAHQLAQAFNGEDGDRVIGVTRVFDSIITEVCCQSSGLVNLIIESFMEAGGVSGKALQVMINDYDSSIMGRFVRQVPID